MYFLACFSIMIVHCTINELNQVGAMCSVHSAQCTVHCYLTGDAKPSEGSRHFAAAGNSIWSNFAFVPDARTASPAAQLAFEVLKYCIVSSLSALTGDSTLTFLFLSALCSPSEIKSGSVSTEVANFHLQTTD